MFFWKSSSPASRRSTMLLSILLKLPCSWGASAGTGEAWRTLRRCYGARYIFLHWIISTHRRIFFGDSREFSRHGSNDPPLVLYQFLFSISPIVSSSFPISKGTPLAPQILAVSYRLRYLALAGDAELLRPILQLGPADFPLLKSMRMKSLSTQTPCTNILEVPTLEDVTLYMTGSNDPLSLPLRWLQLRRLRLECFIEWPEAEGGLGIDGALQVLRMCPNLEWCELRVTKHSEHSGLASNMTPIILPQLHTLVLSGWEFHFDKWIDLVAPNLRSLQIGQINSPPNPSQSNSRRLTVDLDFTRFTTRSLQEILRSLPMISHLQLVPSTYEPDYMTLDDEFMTLFSPPHNLCPMLIDIELVLSPSSKFSDVALLAFIKARTIMPTPLQRVQAYFNRSMELDLMPELQSFISDGLQVTLQYPPSQYAFRARDGLEGPGAFY
ncbi:hypothetical protein MSAN_01879100 [Mycena sanguinolenta]|uniref:F-box domain-containing protein n=1 Tax=Mycena sanguinolenta TaxID=230812 RepID=A0A8H7CQK2_9AGAR|nr:hypothetical protein MSAN_01879100 [Mycena sanguinolenta]